MFLPQHFSEYVFLNQIALIFLVLLSFFPINREREWDEEKEDRKRVSAFKIPVWKLKLLEISQHTLFTLNSNSKIKNIFQLFQCSVFGLSVYYFNAVYVFCDNVAAAAAATANTSVVAVVTIVTANALLLLLQYLYYSISSLPISDIEVFAACLTFFCMVCRFS